MSVQTIYLPSKQSVKIKNKVLTITYDHPYSEYNFDRKFQDKISPSNQGFETPEEELIEFKGAQEMEGKNFS